MIVHGDDPVSRRLEAIGQEFGHDMALDLTRIRAALRALGDPHKRCPPVFHVAGTNGKGSTCAVLRAIFEAAGLRAHVFTSPHLIRPNERVRLAGRIVDDETMIDAIDRVAATGVTVTYFEAQTAAALLLFAEIEADVLVLEVGLGGRLDATNVVDAPAVTVITPIGLDHMTILGDTIAAIAREKAGILKRGVIGVVARQEAEAAETIEREAAQTGAPLLRCGVEWDCWRTQGRLALQTEDRFLDLPAPALFGPHQYANAGLAAIAALAWGDKRVTDEAIAGGVAGAYWPARMQRLKRGPLAELAAGLGAELWLDGGHNPHGARAIAAALDELAARAPRETVLICGMLTNKDATGFLRELAGCARKVVTAPFAAKHARPPAAFAAEAAQLGFDAYPAEDLADAVRRAASLAAAPRILICGSLYLAGEALAQTEGVA